MSSHSTTGPWLATVKPTGGHLPRRAFNHPWCARGDISRMSSTYLAHTAARHQGTSAGERAGVAHPPVAHSCSTIPKMRLRVVRLIT
eukprot:1235879-Alexandrium_andersonii.AAC.1